MITGYILSDLPAGTSRAELVTAMREIPPRWQNAKELIRKTFLYDPAGNQTNFDTPLVVDNALGRVVEAASPGEPSAQAPRG